MPSAKDSVDISAAELTQSFLQDIENFYAEVQLLEDTEGDYYLSNDGVPFYLEAIPAVDHATMQKNGKRLCGLRGDLRLSKEQRAQLERRWEAYKNCTEARRALLK